MWEWINRRRRLRRENDIKIRMKEVVEEKHQTSLELLAKLRQFTFERRINSLPVEMERRKFIS